MKAFLLTCLLTCAALASAHAQDAPAIKTMVSGKGVCESLILAGKSVPCVHATGVIYALLQNGRLMVTISPSENKLLSFVGERDSQPNLTLYDIEISHIDISADSDISEVTVTGACRFTMSADGKIWHELTCKTQGEHGGPYGLNFHFANIPVTVSQ